MCIRDRPCTSILLRFSVVKFCFLRGRRVFSPASFRTTLSMPVGILPVTCGSRHTQVVRVLAAERRWIGRGSISEPQMPPSNSTRTKLLGGVFFLLFVHACKRPLSTLLNCACLFVAHKATLLCTYKQRKRTSCGDTAAIQQTPLTCITYGKYQKKSSDVGILTLKMSHFPAFFTGL